MGTSTEIDRRGPASRSAAHGLVTWRATGLALWTLVVWAGCVPSQSALRSPVHAQANARLGQDIAWQRGAAEVEALLQSPLTADSAARIALLNNAGLQAAFEELGIRGAALARATTPHNPELELELTSPLDGDGEPELELQVMQDLSSLLTIPGRRGVARAELAAARWRAVAAAVDLAADAQQAYYRTLAAMNILAMQRTIHEAASASFELARRLHQAGNITDLAFAQEQALVEQTRLDLAAAELAVTQERERLQAVLGLWGEQTGWTLAGQLPALPASTPALEALEAEAVARSLALEELRAAREAAARAVGLARMQSWIPELGVGLRATREPGAEAGSEAGDWHAGPAVALSLPLFDLLGQSKRATAWAQLRQVEHRYRARAVEVRSAARALARRIEAAHQRAVHLRDVVLPLRERIVAESVLQYNAMNLSPFELLMARQQQIQTARQYLEAVRDFWVAQVALAQLRAGGAPPTAEPAMQDAAGIVNGPARDH